MTCDQRAAAMGSRSGSRRRICNFRRFERRSGPGLAVHVSNSHEPLSRLVALSDAAPCVRPAKARLRPHERNSPDPRARKPRQGKAETGAGVGRGRRRRPDRDAGRRRDRWPVDLVPRKAAVVDRPGRGRRHPRRHRRADRRQGRATSCRSGRERRKGTVAVRNRQPGVGRQMASGPGRRRRRQGPACQHPRRDAGRDDRPAQGGGRSGGGEFYPRPAHLRPHQGTRRFRQRAVAAARRGDEFARSGQAAAGPGEARL